MNDKKIFNVENIDAAALADSYGLVSVPRVRFLSRKGITLKGTGGEETSSSTNEKETESAKQVFMVIFLANHSFRNL